MYYDADRAKRVVSFFRQRLTHVRGAQFAGKPFEPLPWQTKILCDLFGTLEKPEGKRQYRSAYVEVAKKNGKSELAAGIALQGLFDGEPGAEVYLAASTRDQAGIVFRTAAQMVRNNGRLSDACRIIDSSKTIYLKDEPTSFLKAISADAGNQDGINPSRVIFDELHRQKTRDLWDVLAYGMDAREQPMLVSITTAGVTDESPICWEQHEYARQVLSGIFRDPTYYAVIYGLEMDEAWDEPGQPAEPERLASLLGKPPSGNLYAMAGATGWHKANPSLEGNPDGFLKLETVQKAADKAKRSPAGENSFRRFRLDQWVAQETRWIPLAEWDKCGEPFNPEELVGQTCYAGLDLSTTTDVTAFVLAFPIDDWVYLLAWFWLPEEGIHLRNPSDLARWAKLGFIELTPGNVIDYAFVRKRINQLGEVYDIREIAHDPWNATQVTLELTGDGFTCVPTRQGYVTLSPPSKEFEKLVLARKIRHGGNPVLRWMMDSTSVKQDPAGNIKPVKPDRRTSSKRIDGIVASIMGLDRIMRHGKEVEPLTADSVRFG